jgi:hypothetical protein
MPNVTCGRYNPQILSVQLVLQYTLHTYNPQRLSVQLGSANDRQHKSSHCFGSLSRIYIVKATSAEQPVWASQNRGLILLSIPIHNPETLACLPTVAVSGL